VDDEEGVRNLLGGVQLRGAVEVALFRAAEERERNLQLERARRHGDQLATD
jgi:hypothetical protein